MRKRRIFGLLTVVLLAGATTQAAGPSLAGPAPPMYMTDNVEFIKNIPEQAGAAGAKVIGRYFYVMKTDEVSIYDLTDPLSPVLTGSASIPGPLRPFAEESPDTNGKILLANPANTLYVFDVSDKTKDPEIIGELAGVSNHTMTCILKCTYAYGSGGDIVNLEDPTDPKLVGDWTADKHHLPAHQSHDVTEVAPGFVVTSSQPIMYLDVRDPVSPKLRAFGSNADDRYIHGNLWPNFATDDFLLVGGETEGDCDEEDSGAFMVWDARSWKTTQTFKMLDQLRMHNGDPSQGNAASDVYCAHWFDTHPSYLNGGLVAMGWYQHGVRFIMVTPKGEIQEVGWYLPTDGETSAAYWVGKQIVYSVDYERGIDILRFTGQEVGGPTMVPIGKNPWISLGVSPESPALGSMVSFDTRLRACKLDDVKARGTRIYLMKKNGARFEPVASKLLGGRCRATFTRRANYSAAVFRAFWPRQLPGYRAGNSLAHEVQTSS